MLVAKGICTHAGGGSSSAIRSWRSKSSKHRSARDWRTITESFDSLFCYKFVTWCIFTKHKANAGSLYVNTSESFSKMWSKWLVIACRWSDGLRRQPMNMSLLLLCTSLFSYRKVYWSCNNRLACLSNHILASCKSSQIAHFQPRKCYLYGRTRRLPVPQQFPRMPLWTHLSAGSAGAAERVFIMEK